MTKKKKQPLTRLELMLRQISELLTGETEDDFRFIIQDEPRLADAFSYINQKQERIDALHELFMEAAFQEDVSPDKARYYQYVGLKIGQIFEAINALNGDADEAWMTLFGVRTSGQRKKEKRMGEMLSSVAHLSKCLNL